MEKQIERKEKKGKGAGEKHLDVRKIFEVWVDSEMKVEILVFYHNNPGVIETIEGLAKRLGKSVETMRKEIADHIELGVLKEKHVDHKVVLVYNKAKEDEIKDFIERELSKKTEEPAGGRRKAKM